MYNNMDVYYCLKTDFYIELQNSILFCILNYSSGIFCLSIFKILVRGHPFMTSTRRGNVGQAQVDGGGGQAPCGRPQKN